VSIGPGKDWPLHLLQLPNYLNLIITCSKVISMSEIFLANYLAILPFRLTLYWKKLKTEEFLPGVK